MLDAIYNWFKSAPVEKGTMPAFYVDRGEKHPEENRLKREDTYGLECAVSSLLVSSLSAKSLF